MKKQYKIALILLSCFLFQTSVFAVDLRVLVTYSESAKQLYPDVLEKTGSQCLPNGRCYPYSSYSDTLKTRINQIFAETNTIFAVSGVNINLIPVGFVQLSSFQELYNDANLGLSTLTRDPQVSTLRNNFKADIVSLFTLKFEDKSLFFSRVECGNGYLPKIKTYRSGGLTKYEIDPIWPRQTYNVIGINGCPTYVLAHEVGHNLGIGHSPKNSVPRDQFGYIFKYGTGYGVDGVFSTLMTYGPTYGVDNALGVFSNPNKTCVGLPCGSTTQNAALALNNIASTAATLGTRCQLITRPPSSVSRVQCDGVKVTLGKGIFPVPPG